MFQRTKTSAFALEPSRVPTVLPVAAKMVVLATLLPVCVTVRRMPLGLCVNVCAPEKRPAIAMVNVFVRLDRVAVIKDGWVNSAINLRLHVQHQLGTRTSQRFVIQRTK